MITASQVNDLRQRTGISMMACKKALEEAGGDEEKAIEILRKKGAAKAAEKADRVMKEGKVIIKTAPGIGVIVKILCETDFVSKNEEFIKIGEKAAETAVKKGMEAAKTEADVALKDLFAKLGENMGIEIEVLKGENIESYLHTNERVGTLVNLKKKDAEKGRDVAMHITAMKPEVVRPEEVKEDVVIKEREIWKEQLKTEGKPEAIWDKIMMGKEKKFREEMALLKQAFVKDASQTIEQFLGDNTVEKFIRMSL
ncbi:translation elongation factor Ts [Candidatus Peregrinibacteria bacterium]|nr:translation elongation factor Ts [Candidatus Peregrinibacteria bacterium]